MNMYPKYIAIGTSCTARHSTGQTILQSNECQQDFEVRSVEIVISDNGRSKYLKVTVEALFSVSSHLGDVQLGVEIEGRVQEQV